MRFAAKLDSHRYGLLNYRDHSITTAKAEGTNNKIKVLKRQAYGFRAKFRGHNTDFGLVLTKRIRGSAPDTRIAGSFLLFRSSTPWP
jgi:hypothetical protein